MSRQNGNTNGNNPNADFVQVRLNDSCLVYEDMLSCLGLEGATGRRAASESDGAEPYGSREEY